MKPLGVSWDMQVRVPTPIEDAIWGAVQVAVDMGWTVEQFRRECAQAWSQKLADDREAAEKEWKK